LIEHPSEDVLCLRLNRPHALNAFTFDMYSQLLDVLEKLQHDSTTRVVILTGSGRGFCAGHDMKEGGTADWVPAGVGRVQSAKFVLSKLGQIPILMRRIPQPIVCAVNGTAAGFGYSLALAADMTIAAKSAKFVNSFHNAGTGHELGLSYMLPRAVGAQRAAEILYTSRPVPADEAERIGLVLRAVEDERLMESALEIAKSIAANVPIGIWLTKQSLWLNQSAGSLEAAIEMENRAIAASQATEDALEKRAAFREKRSPQFRQK
jgi:enoyl-CoA hydratase